MDNPKLYEDYDVVCVGAGLSGSVIAERSANIDGKRVLVLESRDHIGGNCYDHIDETTGIRVSKYGAHLFHTNIDKVWEYLQQFTEWTPYEHKVVGKVEGKLVPVPVNITTVNKLFDLNIENEEQMNEWLSTNQVKPEGGAAKNGEEAAKARVGETLFKLIFETYTIKQWDKHPRELDASVLERIPVRNNFDDRYFGDKHQALPTNGYTRIFENMLNHPNITVVTSVDFFAVRSKLKCNKIYFTGPIDKYFADKGLPKLEYRSINFKWDTFMNKEYFQENSVVNYPGSEVEFTRIVEYKHFLNQKSDHTVISVETTTSDGDPYYPVPNDANKALYEKYRQYAEQESDVIFVGRLASYKYFNMDQAVDNALTVWEQTRDIM